LFIIIYYDAVNYVCYRKRDSLSTPRCLRLSLEWPWNIVTEFLRARINHHWEHRRNEVF